MYLRGVCYQINHPVLQTGNKKLLLCITLKRELSREQKLFDNSDSSYADGPGSPESIKAYLKQAPPSKGPTVYTKKVGENEAVLEWDQLPVDVQNGFIRKYTIFYRTIIGNETAMNVDSSHTEHTLSSLSSDTLYLVRMTAYTDEGGKDGPEFTFTTPKFAQGEVGAIVMPVCLAFVVTTLLGVLFCFNKGD
ncbi:Interleukin-6 receptor subunit beta [Saguinus oedipus]|uniref:Interleukin-6 receptor subunit beta n=1 Tax=Saguinus oedipus TaxID=9490 RepID=A0ABQ9VDU8_SAGOE|nr:Interleukin-6 receptor subunit beta [Saguinus oedipus]